MTSPGAPLHMLRSRMPLLLLVASCFVFLLISTNFNSYNNGTHSLEDAHIQYRFAQNLHAGHGLVFNQGERLEGYSVLLWILYLAFWHLLGIGPILVATLSDAVAGLSLMGLLYHYAGKTDRQADRYFLRSFLPAFVGLNYYLMYWVLGGFGTLVFTVLLTWALLRLAREYVEKRHSWGTIVLIAVLYLLRVEGSSVLLFALALKFLQHRMTGTTSAFLRKVALPLAFVVAAFIVWRLAYYGELMSNVFYSKCFQLNHYSGLQYYLEFLKECGWLLTLGTAAGLLLLAFEKGGIERKIILAFLCLFPLQHFISSGDHWPYYKYIMPVLPLCLYLSCEGWLSLSKYGLPRVLCYGILLALACGWQSRPTSGILHHFNPHYAFGALERNHFGLLDRELSADSKTRNLQEIGTWLRLNTPKESTVALEAAGIIPYYADRRIIDYLGLLSREVTRLSEPKDIAAFVFDQDPEFMLISKFAFPPHMRGQASFAVGRHLLDDPRFPGRYGWCKSFPFIVEELNFPMVPGMAGKRIIMDLYCRKDMAAQPAASDR